MPDRLSAPRHSIDRLVPLRHSVAPFERVDKLALPPTFYDEDLQPENATTLLSKVSEQPIIVQWTRKDLDGRRPRIEILPFRIPSSARGPSASTTTAVYKPGTRSACRFLATSFSPLKALVQVDEGYQAAKDALSAAEELLEQRLVKPAKHWCHIFFTLDVLSRKHF